MVISAINNRVMSFGGNPVSGIGTLVITMLALNAIQGIPRANAGLYSGVCVFVMQ